MDGFELRHTRDAQNAVLHDAAHSGERGAHDGRVAMERFEGGDDFEARVTPQCGIDLLEDESGGIDGKLRGHEGEGLTDFGGWEIAALRGDGQHAGGGVLGAADKRNGDRMEAAHGEVHGSVAGAREIVRDEEAVHGGQLSTKRCGQSGEHGSPGPIGNRPAGCQPAPRFDFGPAGR